MLTNQQDAYGQAIYESFRGTPTPEIVERDDGFIGASPGSAIYFAPFRRWWPHERRAIRYARGRVLDVGCGAGRVLLHLQERGHDCLGIDISPLAVKVCRERGARDARTLSVTQVDARLGRFDTIVMYGNNFGLLGGPKRAPWMLRRFAKITGPSARILASSGNPYRMPQPEDRAYHRYNRERGRMAGQLRLRVRHRTYATPWFDYLIVSPNEMRGLLKGTGWRIARIFDSGEFRYTAVIEKIP
jgi:SAM-dependent methyltransferase